MTATTNPINRKNSGLRIFTLNYSELATIKQQVDEFKRSAMESKAEIPAKLSLMIYKNQSKIDKKYFEYEKLRQQILINNCEREENGEIKLDENKQFIFKDEEQLNLDITELLKQEIKLEIITPNMNSIERNIDSIKGDEKVLDQLWYILDVFENFKNE